VNIFSADAAWTPSFLLAPVAIVQAQNTAQADASRNQGNASYGVDERTAHILALAGYSTGKNEAVSTEQSWRRWEDIRYAPTVVHPLTHGTVDVVASGTDLSRRVAVPLSDEVNGPEGADASFGGDIPLNDVSGKLHNSTSTVRGQSLSISIPFPAQV